MMKLRKTLVTLLVLSMILAGFTGVAGATFSDTANSAAKNKIEKLAALGVLAGYPDGTFKPDNNITRAEFAKIACILAGLKSSGDILKNSPSKFSDVKAGEWFTGWVNLAVSQGYMKGYPDGTFKPQSNISNAEVLTVLCRLLGYNDNLPGEWPIEYLVKAADLDISKGVTFDSSAPATRANVCWFSEQSLEVDNVEWNKDKDKFDKILPAESILSEAFEGGVKEDALCYDWEIANDKLRVSVWAKDGNGGFNPAAADSKTWTVNKDVTLNGAAHVSGLANKIIDFIVNDDNEIIYAEVKAYGSLSDVEAKKVSNTKLTINDKSYTVNAGAIGKVVGQATTPFSGADWDQYADINATADGVWDGTDRFDKIYALLNSDGEVAFVYSSASDNPGVVKSVNSTTKKITFKTGAVGAQNANLSSYNTDATNADKTVIVFRDGKVASVIDIKENDLLWVDKNANGYDYKLTARSTKAEGTLEEHNSALTSFTVAGTSYKTPTGVGAAAFLSTDGGDVYSGFTKAADFNDVLGEKVAVLLDGNGRFRYMISDATSTEGSQYGVVAEVYGSTSVTTGDWTTTDIEIFTKDGKLHKYAVNADSSTNAKVKKETAAPNRFFFDVKGDSWVPAPPPGAWTVQADDILLNAAATRLVKFTLQSNGAIDTFSFVSQAGATGAVDPDLHTVVIGAATLGMEGAVVFDVSAADKDDWEVVGWKDLEDAAGAGAVTVKDYKDSDGDITYLAAGTAIAATTDYAMYTGKGYDANGPYIKILDANGAVVKKTCVSNFDSTDPDWGTVAKGDVITYTVTGGKIATITVKPGNQAPPTGDGLKDVVTSVVRSGVKKIKVKDNAAALDSTAVYKFVDGDTLFFDFTDTDATPLKITLDDVQELDNIKWEADAKDVLKWVVVVK